MALSVFLGLFAIAASVIVFVLARKRVGIGPAVALSAVAFLGICGVMFVGLQVALSGMNG